MAKVDSTTLRWIYPARLHFGFGPSPVHEDVQDDGTGFTFFPIEEKIAFGTLGCTS